MGEEKSKIQRSRQICKNRCCCFLNGKPVSVVQYALSRKGQSRETSALETQIPCLTLPETISRVEKTGIYMGVPVGRIPKDPLNFPVYVFDGKTHQFIRDASLKEYDSWGAAVSDSKRRATHR